MPARVHVPALPSPVTHPESSSAARESVAPSIESQWMAGDRHTISRSSDSLVNIVTLTVIRSKYKLMAQDHVFL